MKIGITLIALLISIAAVLAGCTATEPLTGTLSISTADNVTSGNLTLSSLPAVDPAIMTTLESLVEATQGLEAVLGFAAGAFIIIALLALVLWRGDEILYFITGLVTFFIGISWASTYSGISYAMCVLSVYEMLRGLIMAIMSKDPSRGLSQFRALINKVRGWF